MSAPRLLAAAVVLALVLRLGLAAEMAPGRIGGDPKVYDEVAVALAGGHGWAKPAAAGRLAPTALHPPAWPGLLGAADALTDHEDHYDVASTLARPPDLAAGSRSLDAAQARWRTGRVVNALLGTLAVLLIGLIARELWGPRAGARAAL